MYPNMILELPDNYTEDKDIKIYHKGDINDSSTELLDENPNNQFEEVKIYEEL